MDKEIIDKYIKTYLDENLGLFVKRAVEELIRKENLEIIKKSMYPDHIPVPDHDYTAEDAAFRAMHLSNPYTPKKEY